MPSRPKAIAVMLLAEGAVLLATGGWLVGIALADSGAGKSTNALCTGALAAVLAPVFDLLCGATGAVLGLLGVAGLVGGWATFRRPPTAATRLLLLAFALPWGMAAILAGCSAASPQSDPTTSLAALGLATTLGLLHVIAARTRAAPVAIAGSA